MCGCYTITMLLLFLKRIKERAATQPYTPTPFPPIGFWGSIFLTHSHVIEIAGFFGFLILLVCARKSVEKLMFSTMCELCWCASEKRACTFVHVVLNAECRGSKSRLPRLEVAPHQMT
jgi:hypothetical protein